MNRSSNLGAPVGGIGCQEHFGEKIPSPVMIKMFLDRLARFKLPILVTEFDVSTKDENSKAKQLEDFYRLAFSHPAVEGVLMWGFWIGSHWHPDAALFGRDFSPLPAAKAYHKLIFEEWQSAADGRTDSEGIVQTRVFYGTYSVTAGTDDGRTSSTEVRFPRIDKEKSCTIRLK